MTDKVVNMHDPRKIRQQLGVDQNMLLSPKKPEPVFEEGGLFKVLTHHGVFSAEDCARVIADNTPEEWIESVVQSTAKSADPAMKKNVRDSSNIWIERNQTNLWLFDKMLALVMSANQDHFKFDIDFFEALQLVKYEEGQHYDWHCDMGPGHMCNRKVSVTVQLSSPDKYEGGELILDDNGQDFIAPKEVGSVTVFPSFMRHKVSPVTSGTRYSLVVWASGTHRFR